MPLDRFREDANMQASAPAAAYLVPCCRVLDAALPAGDPMARPGTHDGLRGSGSELPVGLAKFLEEYCFPSFIFFRPSFSLHHHPSLRFAVKPAVSVSHSTKAIQGHSTRSHDVRRVPLRSSRRAFPGSYAPCASEDCPQTQKKGL